MVYCPAIKLYCLVGGITLRGYNIIIRELIRSETFIRFEIYSVGQKHGGEIVGERERGRKGGRV